MAPDPGVLEAHEQPRGKHSKARDTGARGAFALRMLVVRKVFHRVGSARLWCQMRTGRPMRGGALAEIASIIGAGRGGGRRLLLSFLRGFEPLA